MLASGHLFDDPPAAAAVRAFLADESNYLLVAYLGGQAAGFIRAHALQQLTDPRRQMFLYEIGVLEEFRRRGAGRALIEHLKAMSRREGFVEIFVLTNSSNSPAMRMYESTGGIRENPDDVMFVYTL